MQRPSPVVLARTLCAAPFPLPPHSSPVRAALLCTPVHAVTPEPRTLASSRGSRLHLCSLRRQWRGAVMREGARWPWGRRLGSSRSGRQGRRRRRRRREEEEMEAEEEEGAADAAGPCGCNAWPRSCSAPP
jgi:hypothetical protein